MQDVSYDLINKFVSEINQMQHQLVELVNTKGELEDELDRLKRVEEESHLMKTSFEEQLFDSHAKNEFLSANLEHEINERKRVEEELRSMNVSLEEQLAKRESEMEMLMNNLKSERESFDQALGNLQQQFDTWLNRIFDGRR